MKKGAGGRVVESFYDARGDFYRRVSRLPDGSIDTETFYDARHNGSISREDGGPAMIDYYPDGTVSLEEWHLKGRQHRVDGPAIVDHREDGSVHRAYYRLNGQAVLDRADLVGRLRLRSAIELRSEFEKSSFHALLDEGVDPKKILDVFEAGVNTAAGIREVLDGAPVEWVVAYEESGPVTSPAPTW